MNAKEKIAQTFYELLGKVDFDQISVSLLCQKSGVSRKTFYAYYDSLFEVAVFLFDESYFKSFCEYSSFTRSYEIHPNKTNAHFFNIIFKDRNRAQRFVNIKEGNSSMIEHAIDVFQEFNRNVMLDVDPDRFAGNPILLDYSSYYTSCAWVMTIAKWLNDGEEDVSPDNIINVLFESMLFFARRSIDLYEK